MQPNAEAAGSIPVRTTNQFSSKFKHMSAYLVQIVRYTRLFLLIFSLAAALGVGKKLQDRYDITINVMLPTFDIVLSDGNPVMNCQSLYV